MALKKEEFSNEELEGLKKNEDNECREEDKPDQSGTVKYFQLFKYATSLDKILLMVALLGSLTAGIAYSYFSIALGGAMDGFVNYAFALSGSANETIKDAEKEIFTKKITEFAISTSLISLIVFVFTYVATVLFNYTAIRQTFKIRELYLSKVLEQDISWHDQNKTGDFSSRISDDLTKIQDGIGDKASIFLFQLAILLTSMIQAFILGWEFTLICLISVPISFAALAFVSHISAKLSKVESEAYGQASVVAEETLSYIKTVVAYEGQEEQSKRYDLLILSAMKNNIRRFFFNGLGSGIMFFCMFVGNAFSLWYGARLVAKGRGAEGGYSVERMIAVYGSIQMVIFLMAAITPLMEVFGVAQGAAYKIFSVIESEAVINKFYMAGKKVKNMQGKITFENVSFNYPARSEVDVLKGLNLSIQPGETVALIGSSGCGKSTIIQLIQRYYDPTSGNVYIDDFNINELNLIDLRNQIGLVGQDPVLFDESITENIRWGNLNATQEDIEESAKKANAHTFITSLPNGYQTLIGERGSQLSVGQKQRIAIARALVRNPAILLLDEATSALDPNTESVVQAALEAASRYCTTVIVAHRLSTVQKANRIIVIQDGNVAEEGSHSSLMALKGAYYNFAQLQLSQTDGENTKDAELESEEVMEKIEEKSEKAADLSKKISKEINVSGKAVWTLMKLHMPKKLHITIGVLSSGLTGIVFLIYGILYGYCIGALSEVDNEKLFQKVNLYCLCYFLMAVIYAAIAFSQAYMTGVAGEELTMNLRSAMFQKILKQEMGWFDLSENGVGSLGAMLSSEAANVQGALGLRVGIIFNTFSTSVICLILGFYFSWKVFLVSISLFPLVMISAYGEQKLLLKENLKQAETLQQSTKLAVEAINNIRTVAALTMERLIQRQYLTKLDDYRRIVLRNNHLRGVVYGSTRALYPLSYVVTLYYGGTLLRTNDVDFLSVIMITQLLISSTYCITAIMAFAPNYLKGYVSANQIYDLLNLEPKTKRTTPIKKFEKQQSQGDIEYKKVSFSYPNRLEIEVLKELDLLALKGKTLALVGSSGCGKSTVVQLLERFYDLNSGQINFGNHDISKVKISDLRLRFGIVMQESNLFSRTIGENIAYGDTTREVSKDEIIEAARNANIHNFIVTLPLGYDTVLGKMGTQLSGGQKQRIAIARALIRNPEVLLLDEATSALDAESEKVVQEALNNASQDRTCIVIAHRLNTIVDANLIAVINDGKIAESGTHQELMKAKTLYWKLHNQQHQ